MYRNFGSQLKAGQASFKPAIYGSIFLLSGASLNFHPHPKSLSWETQVRSNSKITPAITLIDALAINVFARFKLSRENSKNRLSQRFTSS